MELLEQLGNYQLSVGRLCTLVVGHDGIELQLHSLANKEQA